MGTSTFADLTGEITTEGYKQEEETMDAVNDAPSPVTTTSIASEEDFTTTEIEIQTTTSNFDEGVSTEPSEVIQSNFTINETTSEPIMEQTIGEGTSRTNQPEDIRDDLTTEQPKVIMTHMYVMQ